MKFDPTKPIGHAGGFVEVVEVVVVETEQVRGLYTKDGAQIVLFQKPPEGFQPQPPIEGAA